MTDSPRTEPRLRVERGLERYRPLVSDWDAFLGACLRPLPQCGWLHPGRQAARSVLQSDGLRVEWLPWREDAFRILEGPSMADSLAYRAGLLHIQEEASMIPARMLAPRPHERILDLCAAPGNKTVELALAVGPSGLVVANDRAGGRLNVLRTTLDRLGLLNVVVAALDGRRIFSLPGALDAVLVDAPCSCDGTVRKHPRAAWRTSEKQRAGLVRLQSDLLENAVRLTRSGGRLVYSTCSFAPEENEGVVHEALVRHPALRIVPVSLRGLQVSPGLRSWAGRSFHKDLAHAVRLWPHEADSGGFFAVLLEKTSGGPASLARSIRVSRSVSQEASATDTGEVDPCRLRKASDSAAPRPFHPPDDLMAWVESEYGLPRDWAAGWTVALTARGLELGPEPHEDVVSESTPHRLTLFRMSGTTPKLTTAGALWLGSRVQKQWVELDRRRAMQFFRREVTIPVAGHARYGYVQVRALGTAIGVGLYRPESFLLESLYPRGWGGLEMPGTT